MKNDTLITLGLLGIGAYVVYRGVGLIAKPISDVAEAVTSPITEASNVIVAGEEYLTRTIEQAPTIEEGLRFAYETGKNIYDYLTEKIGLVKSEAPQIQTGYVDFGLPFKIDITGQTLVDIGQIPSKSLIELGNPNFNRFSIM